MFQLCPDPLLLTAILNRRPAQVEEKPNLWIDFRVYFCRFVSSFGFNWGTCSTGQFIKRQVRVYWVSVYTNIFYSEVAATRKRKAPSSNHSIMNLADLSPETLRQVDKAVKTAELEAPALAEETSRRGRERHAEELRKQVCGDNHMLHDSCIKYHQIIVPIYFSVLMKTKNQNLVQLK